MMNITAIEAMRLRNQCTPEMRSICIELADIHICFPAKASRDDFYDFLTTVFNAGRIAGVRQERTKKENAPTPVTSAGAFPERVVKYDKSQG